LHRKKYFTEKPKNMLSNVNENIKAKEVRLIDENGGNLGIVSINEALKKSQNAGMDLIQVNKDSKNPVCKIMDRGKYLYEKTKKEKDAKASRSNEDKEIRLRPSTDTHDLQIKAKKAKQFLLEGRKVIITVKTKGREVRYADMIENVVDKFYEYVKEISRLEPKGNTFILNPV